MVGGSDFVSCSGRDFAVKIKSRGREIDTAGIRDTTMVVGEILLRVHVDLPTLYLGR